MRTYDPRPRQPKDTDQALDWHMIDASRSTRLAQAICHAIRDEPNNDDALQGAVMQLVAHAMDAGYYLALSQLDRKPAEVPA